MKNKYAGRRVGLILVTLVFLFFGAAMGCDSEERKKKSSLFPGEFGPCLEVAVGLEEMGYPERYEKMAKYCMSPLSQPECASAYNDGHRGPEGLEICKQAYCPLFEKDKPNLCDGGDETYERTFFYLAIFEYDFEVEPPPSWLNERFEKLQQLSPRQRMTEIIELSADVRNADDLDRAQREAFAVSLMLGTFMFPTPIDLGSP